MSEKPTQLWGWSARDLCGALRRREVSAREALAAHHERIDAVNGPLNAVVIEDREGRGPGPPRPTSWPRTPTPRSCRRCTGCR